MNKSEQLIACLEGEIAKRDARIVELESRYQRDVYGLNNEGDPIGGDPAGGYASDNARLRAELAAIKAQEPVAWEVYYADDDSFHAITRNKMLIDGYSSMAYVIKPLYAAPASEAKAQGDAWAPSVNDYDHSIHSNPDAREWADFFVATFPGLADKHDLMIGWFANAMMAMHDHLARKAQGVVMPERAVIREVFMRNGFTVKEGQTDLKPYVYAAAEELLRLAAPAAPAADAGMVEALEKLARLGNGDKYGNSDGNLIAQTALAAHRAQGVV